ncbi:E3 ubiquitin-protein ligase Rnf220-like [Scyliorhinus canicula]|uniref:E3 ubiquitin-protein ligase Rnf220-like n=1 Tax=Scyliorhinus canicula TaxID=7830 RepID=UPI0018F3DAC3|nr:E3 ubiquitin-protein ligase Rnf220-like [Scyliorhinus canicula]XP_038640606.1 E3 ubiquitin-protein ligase Rnf220-like [Scyliorhinus canicula]XP_038640607.1 E3 ubiquitin-protein ligase Rnf220-like [Scyliorhinus canicula]XP_038640608.1 E3 ubiquitin-protein ligase Rnf220-like [Scyliorhinus canicula]
MESSAGLLNSLTPTALMVLASTATESTRGTTTFCQQPRTFAVPVTMDKGQVPFLSPSYTLAPMYQQPDRPSVEYPVPLLHLHPQFGMLGYGALQSFPPYQELERFRPAYQASKRPKPLLSVEPPQIRYLASDGAPNSAGSPTAAKHDTVGGPGGMSNSDVPWKNSQQDRNKNVKTAYDCSTLLRCPLCKEDLKRGDLQQHLQQELERLTALNPSCEEESASSRPTQSPSIKEEVESPSGSPVSTEDGHHLERQQTFQQVKMNRESRRNARAKRCKRIRISDEDQIDGTFSKDPRFLDTGEESPSGNQCIEYAWPGLGRHSTQQFPGLRESSTCRAQRLTSRDSDGDLDTDGDELPLCTKFKCSTVERLTGQSQKLLESQDRYLDNVVLRMINTDEERSRTSEILKARISELTHKLLRRETYKCHVCMGSYSVPLASIHCWHIHCEECWLRALGSKKLCPQCNTVTSPGDLRRIYL